MAANLFWFLEDIDDNEKWRACLVKTLMAMKFSSKGLVPFALPSEIVTLGQDQKYSRGGTLSASARQVGLNIIGGLMRGICPLSDLGCPISRAIVADWPKVEICSKVWDNFRSQSVDEGYHCGQIGSYYPISFDGTTFLLVLLHTTPKLILRNYPDAW